MAASQPIPPHSVAVPPRLGVPLLEAFQVTYGPPGVLGRFFLNVDQRMRQKGIVFSFVPYSEIAEASARNASSLGWLNPMFNPELSHIVTGETMCIAGKNTAGEIVAVVCGKHFDASKRTLKEIINDGHFLALKEERNAENLATRITAPIAETIRGQVSYCGGVWVRPDVRGLRLPALLSRLMNACMLTLWNPDYVMGFVKAADFGTDLQKRYGYEKSDRPMFISKNGELMIEAVLLWMTADDVAEDTARFLDVLWPEIDAAVVARGR